MTLAPQNTQPDGGFVISLDLELLWGVRDHKTIAQYGPNILGVRDAVPAILAALKAHDVACTWATVGMLFAKSKKDIMDYIPAIKPSYENPKLNPYTGLDAVGENETSDPYHFGRDLILQIQDTPRQEISTHTFGHFYCLEPGATVAAFQADLNSSIAIMQRDGIRPQSIVFPRNQYNADFVNCCVNSGVTVMRGSEQSGIYKAAAKQDHSQTRRALRLIDSYLPITGANAFLPTLLDGSVDVPSSRFLRPWSRKLSIANALRIRRITQAMRNAAKRGQMFHLWFHPHNFGTNLAQNMAGFLIILGEYKKLHDRYGWQSLTMLEAGQPSSIAIERI